MSILNGSVARINIGPDIWSYIFKFLNLKAHARAARTCRFLAQVAARLDSWAAVDVRYNELPEDILETSLARITDLTLHVSSDYLHLSDHSINLLPLARLRTLTLEMRLGEVRPSSTLGLDLSPSVSSLSIHDAPLTILSNKFQSKTLLSICGRDDGYASPLLDLMKRVPNAKLHLNKDSLAINQLHLFDSLSSLSVTKDRSINLTNAKECLAPLQSLSRVRLFGVTLFKNELENLAHLPCLTSLALDRYNMQTMDLLTSVTKIINLQKLCLGPHSRYIDAHQLASLNVKHLHISNPPPNFVSALVLTPSRHITTIISGFQFTQREIALLAEEGVCVRFDNSSNCWEEAAHHPVKDCL